MEKVIGNMPPKALSSRDSWDMWGLPKSQDSRRLFHVSKITKRGIPSTLRHGILI
jgi:hypothetical protein